MPLLGVASALARLPLLPVATRSHISTLMCESVCIYCISDLNYHFQPLPTFSVLTLSFSNIDYSDSCFSVSDGPKKMKMEMILVIF
jgi:hypothetical protein